MKKIIVLVLMTLILTGCKTTTYKTNNEVYWDKFIVIEERRNIAYGSLSIVYDKDTKVMYYFIESTYNQTVSPIYNADGTVMVYGGSEDETDN